MPLHGGGRRGGDHLPTPAWRRHQHVKGAVDEGTSLASRGSSAHWVSRIARGGTPDPCPRRARVPERSSGCRPRPADRRAMPVRPGAGRDEPRSDERSGSPATADQWSSLLATRSRRLPRRPNWRPRANDSSRRHRWTSPARRRVPTASSALLHGIIATPRQAARAASFRYLQHPKGGTAVVRGGRPVCGSRRRNILGHTTKALGSPRLGPPVAGAVGTSIWLPCRPAQTSSGPGQVDPPVV